MVERGEKMVDGVRYWGWQRTPGQGQEAAREEGRLRYFGHFWEYPKQEIWLNGVWWFGPVPAKTFELGKGKREAEAPKAAGAAGGNEYEQLDLF